MSRVSLNKTWWLAVILVVLGVAGYWGWRHFSADHDHDHAGHDHGKTTTMPATTMQRNHRPRLPAMPMTPEDPTCPPPATPMKRNHRPRPPAR